MTSEITAKLKRVADFLDRAGLQALLLSTRHNFAWLSGGRDNHIPNNSSTGVATLYTDGRRILCLCNEIEAPRFSREELAGTSIEVLSHAWYDPAAGRKALADLIGGLKTAADIDLWGADLPALPAAFSELRFELTPDEVVRYMEGGRRATAAVESAARAVRPGMSEFEVAGLLDEQIRRAGMVPVVNLIAADERIRLFRHPIPTAKKVQRHAMLVACGVYGGLISNLTRLVHFGRPNADLLRRHQAVCNVDAAANLATRPGRPLREVFATLTDAYAREGFADEWKLHHQGGSTGYCGREVFGNPTCPTTVRANQAFAWNPSITGTKCEDTVLCTERGIEMITAPAQSGPPR